MTHKHKFDHSLSRLALLQASLLTQGVCIKCGHGKNRQITITNTKGNSNE
jgi:hypothetical protein